MNYLNLLKEISETHSVGLCKSIMFAGDRQWVAEAISHPKSVTDKPTEFITAKADTPEQAIRQLYLKINPILKGIPGANSQ